MPRFSTVQLGFDTDNTPYWANLQSGRLKRPSNRRPVIPRIRNLCRLCYMKLWETNNVFDYPNAYCRDDFNAEHFRLSKNQNPGMYCKKVSGDERHLEQWKIGQTSNGRGRIQRDEEYQGMDNDIIRMVDFNNLDADTDYWLIEELQKLAKDFCFGPDSIPDSFDFGRSDEEQDGLPIPLQIFFHGLAYSLQESPTMGGAMECQAFLPILARMVTETGCQADFGDAILHQRSAMDEWLSYDHAAFNLAKKATIKLATEMFDVFSDDQKKSMPELMSKLNCIMSWAPVLDPGQIEMKPAITTMVHGQIDFQVDRNYLPSQNPLPPIFDVFDEKAENYNPQYTYDQIEEAFGIIEERTKLLEEEGGILNVDINNIAFSHFEGGANAFFESRDFHLLAELQNEFWIYQKEASNSKMAIILLHRPWSVMADSRQDFSFNSDLTLKRAVVANAVRLFHTFARAGKVVKVVAEDLMIIQAFIMKDYLLTNMHIPKKSANLYFKLILMRSFGLNALDTRYHKLTKSTHSDHMALNLRHYDLWAIRMQEADPHYFVNYRFDDKRISNTVCNILSKARTARELLDRVHEAMRYLLACPNPTKTARMYLLKSRGYITGALLELCLDVYEMQKKNSGNSINVLSSDLQRLDRNNRKLTELARTGKFFWIKYRSEQAHVNTLLDESIKVLRNYDGGVVEMDGDDDTITMVSLDLHIFLLFQESLGRMERLNGNYVRVDDQMYASEEEYMQDLQQQCVERFDTDIVRIEDQSYVSRDVYRQEIALQYYARMERLVDTVVIGPTNEPIQYLDENGQEQIMRFHTSPSEFLHEKIFDSVLAGNFGTRVLQTNTNAQRSVKFTTTHKLLSFKDHLGQHIQVVENYMVARIVPLSQVDHVSLVPVQRPPPPPPPPPLLPLPPPPLLPPVKRNYPVGYKPARTARNNQKILALAENAKWFWIKSESEAKYIDSLTETQLNKLMTINNAILEHDDQLLVSVEAYAHLQYQGQTTTATFQDRDIMSRIASKNELIVETLHRMNENGFNVYQIGGNSYINKTALREEVLVQYKNRIQQLKGTVIKESGIPLRYDDVHITKFLTEPEDIMDEVLYLSMYNSNFTDRKYRPNKQKTPRLLTSVKLHGSHKLVRKKVRGGRVFRFENYMLVRIEALAQESSSVEASHPPPNVEAPANKRQKGGIRVAKALPSSAPKALPPKPAPAPALAPAPTPAPASFHKVFSRCFQPAEFIPTGNFAPLKQAPKSAAKQMEKKISNKNIAMTQSRSEHEVIDLCSQSEEEDDEIVCQPSRHSMEVIEIIDSSDDEASTSFPYLLTFQEHGNV